MTRRCGLAAATALCALGTAASAQSVELNIAETMAVREAQIDYGLDLTLSAVAPTRIGIDALIDLRDFQQQLPDLVAGRPVLDVCGNRSVVEDFTVEAQDRIVAASGTLDAQFFICERTGDNSFRRGPLREALQLGFSGAFSARTQDDCIVFEVADLTLSPVQEFIDPAEGNRNLDLAKSLMIEAIGLILEETPLCPALPPELASLDPTYETGEPREVGEGGLGIALSGSVDVSTSTILDVLTVLQREGVIPGPP